MSGVIGILRRYRGRIEHSGTSRPRRCGSCALGCACVPARVVRRRAPNSSSSRRRAARSTQADAKRNVLIRRRSSPPRQDFGAISAKRPDRRVPPRL
ncbi:MAG TPA: hypothetical protein VGC30_04155 [Dokdonella sp.]